MHGNASPLGLVIADGILRVAHSKMRCSLCLPLSQCTVHTMIQACELYDRFHKTFPPVTDTQEDSPHQPIDETVVDLVPEPEQNERGKRPANFTSFTIPQPNSLAFFMCSLDGNRIANNLIKIHRRYVEMLEGKVKGSNLLNANETELNKRENMWVADFLKTRGLVKTIQLEKKIRENSKKIDCS